MTPPFRMIQDCPANYLIAPYICICVTDAHATVNSIYRGDRAAALLHKYGKHTQRELYEGYVNHVPGYYPANPPGFSTHELRSDGVAYPLPRGHALAWWQQGFDVNDSDVPAVIKQAASHGWHLFQPYSSGLEYHHLNFRSQPRPTPRTLHRIWSTRRKLPSS